MNDQKKQTEVTHGIHAESSEDRKEENLKKKIRKERKEEDTPSGEEKSGKVLRKQWNW